MRCYIYDGIHFVKINSTLVTDDNDESGEGDETTVDYSEAASLADASPAVSPSPLDSFSGLSLQSQLKLVKFFGNAPPAVVPSDLSNATTSGCRIPGRLRHSINVKHVHHYNSYDTFWLSIVKF